MIPKYNLQYLDELNAAKKRVLNKQTEQIEIQKPVISGELNDNILLENRKNRNNKSDILLKGFINELDLFNIEFSIFDASLFPTLTSGRKKPGTEQDYIVKVNQIKENIKKANKDYEKLIKDGASQQEISEIKEKIENYESQIRRLPRPFEIGEGGEYDLKTVFNNFNDLLKKILSKLSIYEKQFKKNISNSLFYNLYDINTLNKTAEDFMNNMQLIINKFREQKFKETFFVETGQKYGIIFKKIIDLLMRIMEIVVSNTERQQSTIQPPIMRGSGFEEIPKRNYM